MKTSRPCANEEKKKEEKWFRYLLNILSARRVAFGGKNTPAPFLGRKRVRRT